MKNSKFFNLNWADLGKGLLIAFLTALLGGLLELLQAGELPTTWIAFQPIFELSLAAAVSYLLKNLFTNSDGQIAKGEKSAAEYRAKRGKMLILLPFLLLLSASVSAQSPTRGFLQKVTPEFFVHSEGQKGLLANTDLLIRPSAQVVANLMKWDAVQKKVVNQPFSRLGLGGSLSHYTNTEVEPYNDWSVDIMLFLPATEEVTYFSLGTTFSALDIYGFAISAGPIYDFVKGKTFAENIGFLTGVKIKF